MKNFFVSPKNLEGYLLLIIKVGLIAVLFLPLVVLDGFYFPFIVPRNLIFRLIIDIVFPIYVYLFLQNINWRVKFNKGFVFLVLFVFSLTISSLLAGDFTLSFWSNFERMDGLANWYHLLLYVIVLLGVLREHYDWRVFFYNSLIAAWLVSLVALGQRLDWSFVLSSGGGDRLTSTLGNAAYLATYLFLHIVLALYLLLKNNTKKLLSFNNIWLSLSVIFFTYILITTQTRGAFLGIIFFLFLLGIFYFWFERRQRNVWYYSILSIFMVSIIFVGVLFQQKNATWVASQSLLSKISNTSLADTTIQSRLTIWRNSLNGIKEKPILGWGEENFHYVFNKYFPEEIYRDSGSEIWFDRPHNILVQHLVQGGVIGLFLYLAIFGYLIYYLCSLYRKNNNWLFSFFWIAFLFSFIFQDLFIFDSLSTNVVIYLILAFLFRHESKESLVPKPDSSSRKKTISALIALILLLFFSYFFFWQPFRSNRLLVQSIRTAAEAKSPSDFDRSLTKWKKSFALTPAGIKEKLEVLYPLNLKVLDNPNASIENKQAFFATTQNYFELYYKNYPNDVRINQFLANFYLKFNQVDPSFIDNSLDIFKKLHEFAPQRPDLFISLANVYLVKGDLTATKIVAEEFVELFPWTAEAYWNLLQVNLNFDDLAAVSSNLDKIMRVNLEKSGISFTEDDYKKLENIIYQAENAGNQKLADLVKSYLET